MSSCTAMHFHFFCTYTLLPEYILFFFFNDTATTEIYTLSLHDALPIWLGFEPRKTFELALGATPILLHLVVTLRVLGHSAKSILPSDLRRNAAGGYAVRLATSIVAAHGGDLVRTLPTARVPVGSGANEKAPTT